MPRDAKIGGVFVQFRAQDADFVRAMRRSSQELRKTETSMRGLTQATNRYSNAARTALATFAGYLSVFAVFNSLQNATRSIAAFEKELAKVEGLVGVSSAGVESLGKSILQVSEATGKLPGELAQAAFFITSAGLRGGEAAQVLLQAAKASVAGLGETATVADAVTSALNAYGSANLDAATATGTLVAAVRLGKAEADSIAPVLGRLTGVASELQISFQQLGAGLAFLTGQGLSASEASVGLNAVMKLLVKPSEQALEVMGRYGLELGKVKRVVSESDTGLLDLLFDLRDTLTEVDFGKLFRDSNAINTSLQLTGQNAERAKEIFKDLADSGIGDVNEAFRISTNTAVGQFNIALSKIAVAVQRIGDDLLPSVTNALRRFNAEFERIEKVVGFIFDLAVAFGVVKVASFAIRGSIDLGRRFGRAWRGAGESVAIVGQEAIRSQKLLESFNRTVNSTFGKTIDTLTKQYRKELPRLLKEVERLAKGVRTRGSDVTQAELAEITQRVFRASGFLKPALEAETRIAAVGAAARLQRILSDATTGQGQRFTEYFAVGALTGFQQIYEKDVAIVEKYGDLFIEFDSIREELNDRFISGEFTDIIDGRVSERLTDLRVRVKDEIGRLQNALASETAANVKVIDTGFLEVPLEIDGLDKKRRKELEGLIKFQERILRLIERYYRDVLEQETAGGRSVIEAATAQQLAIAAERARLVKVAFDLQAQGIAASREALSSLIRIDESIEDNAYRRTVDRLVERFTEERNRLLSAIRVASGANGGIRDEAALKAAEAGLRQTDTQLYLVRTRPESVQGFNELNEGFTSQSVITSINEQRQSTDSLAKSQERLLDNLRGQIRLETLRENKDGNRQEIIDLKAQLSVADKLSDTHERIAAATEARDAASDDLARQKAEELIKRNEELLKGINAEVAARKRLAEVQNDNTLSNRIDREIRRQENITKRFQDEQVKSAEELRRTLDYLNQRDGALGNEAALDKLEAEKRLITDLSRLYARLERLKIDLQAEAFKGNEDYNRSLNNQIEAIKRLIKLKEEQAKKIEEILKKQRSQAFEEELTYNRMEALRDVVRTVHSGMEDFLTQSILNFESLSDAAKQFGRVLLEEVVRQLIAAPIASALALGISSAFGTHGASGGGISSSVSFGGAGGVPRLAEGGLGRGLSLVGERGPELVDFGTPARVYTASELSQALNSGGGNTVVTFAPTIYSKGGDTAEIRAEMLRMFPLFRKVITDDVKVKLSQPGKYRNDLQYGVGRS